MRTTRSFTTVTTLGAVAALAFSLAGCASGADDAGGASSETPRPTATDTAASPSASPSTTAPAPSPGPAVASIPTDCTDIVDAATYASTMGDTPLNDPEFFAEVRMGRIEPITPPAGADPYTIVESAAQLRCGWRDIRADVTGLFVDVATVDEATAASYPAWLSDPTVDEERRVAGAVSDCTDRLGGTVCQYTRVEEQYGTDFTQTVLVRDDVVVTVRQSNFPTDDLLGAIVTRIWG
ncbi:hypothetical protein [uncultured Frigoribacterium sp.]|uniref:hypothetical protein n=1 Tax=uncultured Frigoribacterium sp. TaxID=335377 RepID=UPI0028D4AA45|nr:hypothetical protein [uncultured Frigoribacterium sp.]